MNRLHIYLALLGYVGITLAFFWPTIFFNKVPLPTDLAHDYLLGEPAQGYNTYVRDALVQLYPYSDFIFDSYKRGEMPTYNPYIFNGMSFANGQSSAFSPLNLLISFFTNSLSFFSATICIYFFLAGIGMFLFLRKRMQVVLAFAGGMVWQLSGPMMMWLAWGTIDGILAFFPLTLWASTQYIQTKKWYWGIAATVFNYSMLTAGHLQFYIYASGIVILYTLLLWWQLRTTFQKQHYIYLVGWWIINICIMAAVLYPFIEQSNLSHRISSNNTSHLSYHHTLLWLLPNFWGNVTHFKAPLNYLETTGYVGIIPVVFFIFILFRPKFIQEPEVVFWLSIFVVVNLYMFFPGLFIPITRFVPMLAAVPPFRALFVVSFIVLYLALRVFDWQFLSGTGNQLKKISRYFSVGLSSVLLGLAIIGWSFHISVVHAMVVVASIGMVMVVYYFGKCSQSVLLGVILCTMWFDQGQVFYNFNMQLSRDPILNPPAYVTFIAKRTPNALIYSEVSPLNMYALYGLRSLFGYDSTYPQEYYTLIKKHGKIISDHNILNAQIDDMLFLRSLEVDYIVSKRVWDLPVVFQQQGIRVYDVAQATQN